MTGLTRLVAIQHLLTETLPMPLSLLKAYLANPAQVGSVLPSSARLARAMANQAQEASQVLEIGAGTGPITRQLLAAGKAVIAIERDKVLAAKLRLSCPEAQVVEASLSDCRPLMRVLARDTCVVSSLPFKSLPPNAVLDLRNLLVDFLCESPSRRLIQYTYAVGVPFAVPRYLKWRRVGLVLQNVPPAFVWELQQRSNHA